MAAPIENMYRMFYLSPLYSAYYWTNFLKTLHTYFMLPCRYHTRIKIKFKMAPPTENMYILFVPIVLILLNQCFWNFTYIFYDPMQISYGNQNFQNQIQNGGPHRNHIYFICPHILLILLNQIFENFKYIFYDHMQISYEYQNFQNQIQNGGPISSCCSQSCASYHYAVLSPVRSSNLKF